MRSAGRRRSATRAFAALIIAPRAEPTAISACEAGPRRMVRRGLFFGNNARARTSDEIGRYAMKPSILAAALVAATGCATTSGSTTASHYTGYPYNISDDGKRISGLVCGVGVDYSVEQHGDLTRVTGFGLHSQSFEVRPALDGWHVMGSLGTGPAAGELDVLVTPTAVRGRAGLRDVWLQAVN